MPSGSTESSLAAGAAVQEVSRLAGLKQVHEAMAWFRAHEPELRQRQMELAVIPAPPFGEAARAQWVAERIRELGLEDVHIDSVGNVFGLRRGSDPQRLVAVTAHLDTVFSAGTPLNIRSEGERLCGPGISDNAAGVVGMLAIAAALQSAAIEHAASIVFVGNVGEEGEGDLRGMRHIFCDPRWNQAITSTVVLDGAAIDTIVTEALGSKRFEVTVHGPGGHSWSDFGAPNPIVILARAIARFSEMKLPGDPKTSCNVGVISGGTSVNSIPESADMRVDIRSSSLEEIQRVEQALLEALDEAVAPHAAKSRRDGRRVNFEMRLIGSRPAAELDPNARILQVIRAVDAHLGNKARVHRASTDANIPLSLGGEAISIGAGGTGGGAHTMQEWYDPGGRDVGLKRVLLTVLALAGVPEKSAGKRDQP